MGLEQSVIQYASFEDIKKTTEKNYILINTLPSTEQNCLIYNTVSIENEVTSVEQAIKDKSIIIIYGYNTNDSTIYKKYKQIRQQLRHKNVFIYAGGMFEWLLMQDIYGNDEFITTSNELDILKYKFISDINKLLIKN
jgi:hypothetical protein